MSSSSPAGCRPPCCRQWPRATKLLTYLFVTMACTVLSGSAVRAQLPADAVDLALVKIPEAQKSDELCPVELVPSIADGETWAYDGVHYRGSRPGAEEAFMADPDGHAQRHRRQRWINNFMTAMSTIWCPITDEVTPGGRKQIEAHGLTWESCCSFCDEDMSPENVVEALETLEERAAEAYELTGGVYVNDAQSPVEGAIRDDY